MSNVLQAAPPVAPRSEQVEVPEWGGSVVVRGLMASELFALEGLRQQALRRVNEAAAEHRKAVAKLPPGKSPPDFEAPELDFDELRAYGRYISRLLSCAVEGANGMALYSVDEWELVGQQFRAVAQRLQAVAERLSGLNAEDVEKNSTPQS